MAAGTAGRVKSLTGYRDGRAAETARMSRTVLFMRTAVGGEKIINTVEENYHGKHCHYPGKLQSVEDVKGRAY